MLWVKDGFIHRHNSHTNKTQAYTPVLIHIINRVLWISIFNKSRLLALYPHAGQFFGRIGG